jgi:hypothetical protein
VRPDLPGSRAFYPIEALKGAPISRVRQIALPLAFARAGSSVFSD